MHTCIFVYNLWLYLVVITFSNFTIVMEAKHI